MTTTLPTPETASVADELGVMIEALADVRTWLERRPDLNLGYVSVQANEHGVDVSAQALGDDRTVAFAAAARALAAGAPIGAVTKHYDNRLAEVRRDFGCVTLTIYTGRDNVCTARVVGTETVRVPDPNAPTIEVTRDLVEWDCTPVLGGGAA